MKAKFNLLIALFAVLAMTVSCDKNDDPNAKVDEGKPTYMQVSFSFPTAPARAATEDLNATYDEARLVTVDVFIYDTNGVQEKRVRLAAATFTQDASGSGYDTYNATEKIATTTGTKKIFVGVNLPLALSNALDGVAMSRLTSEALDVMPADLTSTTGGFLMFSKEVSTTLVADDSDPANKVTVVVERLSAKITVQKSATMIVTGDGVIQNLEFNIHNFNKKAYLVQRTDLRDPNWAMGSFDPSHFYQHPDTEYKAVDESNVTDVLLLNSHYASENTSEWHLEMETTYASIRAQYIPKTYKEFPYIDSEDGYYRNVTNADLTTVKTFYVVPLAGGNKSFFFNKAVADDYAIRYAGGVADVLTYTDGYCYYNMFLNPRGQGGTGVLPYDVLRNAYYKATISKIWGVGNPGPEPTDPTMPVEAPTNITVDIEVLHWNLIIDSYELRP